MKIISVGEGKAMLQRNKRKGLRLKVRISSPYPYNNEPPSCSECYLNTKFKDNDWNWCIRECKNFERVTGTRHFLFERDED